MTDPKIIALKVDMPNLVTSLRSGQGRFCRTVERRRWPGQFLSCPIARGGYLVPAKARTSKAKRGPDRRVHPDVAFGE
jgi:hypothetical protein